MFSTVLHWNLVTWTKYKLRYLNPEFALTVAITFKIERRPATLCRPRLLGLDRKLTPSKTSSSLSQPETTSNNRHFAFQQVCTSLHHCQKQIMIPLLKNVNTWDTSHPEISWLKDSAAWNIPLMSTTFPTSQEETSPSNFVAPQNILLMSIAREVCLSARSAS